MFNSFCASSSCSDAFFVWQIFGISVNMFRCYVINIFCSLCGGAESSIDNPSCLGKVQIDV